MTRRSSTVVQVDTGDPFSKHLRQVLLHSNDVQWIGEHSPLASPYMLGSYCPVHTAMGTTSATMRGQALLDVIATALLQLHERHRRHIMLRFYEQRPREVLLYEMGMSVNTLTTHLQTAIHELGAVLRAMLVPTLRPERPRPIPHMLGREHALQQCQQALRNEESVAIMGLAGVGKTTLAAAVLATLDDTPTCWLTLRLNINDSLSGVAFALGYALAHHGADQLWQYVTVSQSGLDEPETILALLRHDVELLRSRTQLPVFCFDEVELLRPAGEPAHTAIVSLFEGLRQFAPLLLVGQHLVIDSDHVIHLGGLAGEAVTTLLAQAGVDVTPREAEQVLRVTRGNPRMLQLLLALHDPADSFDATLATLRRAPSLDGLLDRVWRRLTGDEQSLLLALCVFRRPVPRAAWDATLLEQLHQRHLLDEDVNTGVAVMPLMREGLLVRMSTTQRAAFEQDAARLRLALGEYTEATYHLVAAGQTETAVRFWYSHRRREVEQGQGRAALAIFSDLTIPPSATATRELLQVVQAELAMLVGDYERVQRTLSTITTTQPMLRYQAYRIEGDRADLQQMTEQAIVAYEQGLQTVQHLQTQAAIFRKKRAWGWYRLNESEQAWDEAQRALCDVEMVLAYIAQRRGALETATAYCEAVLARAEPLGYAQALGNAHDVLAGIAQRQLAFAVAEHHMHAAIAHYQQVGKLHDLTDMRVNLASLYHQMGHYEQAITTAGDVLRVYERLGDSWGEAVALQAQAEAWLALGDLSAAEQAAQRVLVTEDSHTRADGLRVLAEVALLRDEAAEALRYIQQAIATAQVEGDPYLEAYALRTRGKIHLHLHQTQQAQQSLDAAIALFRAQDLVAEVDQTRILLP